MARRQHFDIGGIQPERSGYAQEEHDRPRARIVWQPEDVAQLMHRHQVQLVLGKAYLRIECDPALKRGPVGKLSARSFGRWEEPGVSGEDVDRTLPAVLTL